MRRLAATIGLAIALGLTSLGVVQASIPDSGTGVITGCYKNSTGDLRVIDAQANQTCAGSETSLTWSQTGPQGDPGISGYEFVVEDVNPPFLAQTQRDYQVHCPVGKKVISGGWDSSSTGLPEGLEIEGNFPITNGQGWRLRFVNTTNTDITSTSIVAYALCAVVPT